MPRKTKHRVQSASHAEMPVEAGLVRRVVGAKPKRVKTVRFDYMKSHIFRVIHADGFQGGLTPGGKVQMSIFSERRPIARSEVYNLTSQATLGSMKSRLERDALVREVEATVLMDIDKAISLREWLNKVIENVMEIQNKAAKMRKRV